MEQDRLCKAAVDRLFFVSMLLSLLLLSYKKYIITDKKTNLNRKIMQCIQAV